MRHHFHAPTRREWLARAANGFGALALTAQLARESRAGAHHAARAKAVIFLYMDGGPSQVDTFDYKPALAKYHGQDPVGGDGQARADAVRQRRHQVMQ